MSSNGNNKNGYFIRCIGEERECLQICREINETRGDGDGQFSHLATNKLEVLTDRDQIELLGSLYKEWEACLNKSDNQVKELRLPIKANNKAQKERFNISFQKTMDIYLKDNQNASESMTKNFIIKFFGWISKYVFELYIENQQGEGTFKKIIFSGDIKPHEYLFLFFLSESGCDVLYVYAKESNLNLKEEWKTLSETYVYKGESTLVAKKPHIVSLPQSSTIAEKDGNQSGGSSNGENVKISMESMRRKDRHGRNTKEESPEAVATTSAQSNISHEVTPQQEVELSYEALALKANSVVMIKVYDEKGEYAKSGSGVVISEKGYILTNFHVIAGGNSYGIFFENDETEYLTTDLIKCHNFNDMAILRAEKKGACLKLYDGVEIPRGKQVVAIGSPLGLFNTVSNGIVSGFRNIGDVSMIQFTAPISHGSSGGALLDLKGRMIGLITAGYDDGQNLNLAVDYKTIGPFIRGFL